MIEYDYTYEVYEEVQKKELRHWKGTSSWDKEGFTNNFIKYVRKRFDFKEGKLRLEVGSGPYGAFHIKDSTLLAIDPLMEGYQENIKGKWFTPVKGTGEDMPFFDNTFDYVFCLNVLDHTYNPQEVVNEIHRIMIKGGTLCVYIDIRSGEGVSGGVHFKYSEEYLRSLFNNLFDVSNLGVDTKSPHSGNALVGELIKI